MPGNVYCGGAGGIWVIDSAGKKLGRIVHGAPNHFRSRNRKNCARKALCSPIGGGMGAALNAAQAMNAYTISDRGTWLSFGNKGDLTVLVEGDPSLLNRYDVILLNPAKHPVPKQDLARRFAQWLLSPEGQAAIGEYKVHGEQLFHPW